MKVKISDIVTLLNGKVLFGGEKDYVIGVLASGLMSDVLTTDKEEFLLVTGLTTPQVVRTADMVVANAILLTNGKQVPEDTIELARELKITLLWTPHYNFEACVLLGKLFPVEPPDAR
ncbi:MAG: hypothetical protein A2Y33_04340 [Spirochaetes bacterium GWF1_51_8]|nr:MAG: hypothetical protein A2Y33_04340 [Spirochaetes bacterium GWF1_51_8]